MITLMLTSVIYVEYMQISIPVFDTVGETPYLLRLFLATVGLLALSLLGMSFVFVPNLKLISNSVTVVTSFFYHISCYELINFSRTEARISIALAKFFTKITFGLWVIEVPTEVQNIEADVSDQRHLQFSIKAKKQTREADKGEEEEGSSSESIEYYSLADDAHPLRIGFRFLADMINRLFFMLVCCSLVVTLGMTLFHVIIQYDYNDDEILIRLENDAQLDNVKPRSVNGNLSCTIFCALNFSAPNTQPSRTVDAGETWQINRTGTWLKQCHDNTTLSFMFKQMTASYGDEFLTMVDEDGDVVFGERIRVSFYHSTCLQI